MNKININSFLAIALIVIALFFVFAPDKYRKSITSLNKTNEQLRELNTKYQHRIDSINFVLLQYEDTIVKLSNQKPKIETKYVTKLKAFSNPSVISDDSITRYISEKIHNR